MKVTNLLILALDKIRSEKKNTLLGVGLICMSLLYMGIILYYRASYAYSEDSAQALLTEGIDRTGLICWDDMEFGSEESKKFLHSAKESEIITGIGHANKLVTFNLPELAKTQQTFLNTEEQDGLTWLFMTYTFADGVCELHCSAEIPIPEEQWQTENWFGLYLGADFKDVPIGTCYKYRVDENTEFVYEVVGRLREGERFISESLFSGSGAADGFSTYYVLDSLVICVADVPPGSAYMGYSVADGYTLADGEAVLGELAEEYGMSLRFSGMRDYFTENIRRIEGFLQVYTEIFYLILFVAIVIVVSVFCVSFLNHVNEYGIFYTMGLSKHELQGMFIVVNGIKSVFALLVSCTLLYLYLKRLNAQGELTLYILNDIFFHNILIHLAIIVAIYTVLFSVAPFLILNYCKPVTLMKGNRI
ncbi:MAG: ABC transporter permease [Roseburia sp.]|nr:ABC transporter permease [Roseburia sp.]